MKPESATVISTLGMLTTYSATVTLKVPLGASLGDVPLAPEPPPVDTTNPSSPPTISGQITSGAAGETPAVADVSLAALQPLDDESSAIVAIPVFRNSVPNIETSGTPTSGSCPTRSGTHDVHEQNVAGQFVVEAALRRHLAIPQSRDRRYNAAGPRIRAE